MFWLHSWFISFRLKNVDRTSAQAREITMNNLTIRITEYKVKEKRNQTDNYEQSSASDMSNQSESGFDSSVASHSSRASHSYLWCRLFILLYDPCQQCWRGNSTFCTYTVHSLVCNYGNRCSLRRLESFYCIRGNALPFAIFSCFDVWKYFAF